LSRLPLIALAAEQWRRLARAPLPGVVLAAALVGAGLALGSGPAAGRADDFVAAGAAVAWVRELAPLVAALVAAARLGSALAGELGAMRVTDQIDALLTLAADPLRHLVAPRVLAAAAALPALAALADAVGLAAVWALAVGLGGARPGGAAHALLAPIAGADVALGLARALLFGVALAGVGCAAGLAVRGGALEVGAAARRAAAASLLAVLALHDLHGAGEKA